jgi:hypothetical protein
VNGKSGIAVGAVLIGVGAAVVYGAVTGFLPAMLAAIFQPSVLGTAPGGSGVTLASVAGDLVSGQTVVANEQLTAAKNPPGNIAPTLATTGTSF